MNKKQWLEFENAGPGLVSHDKVISPPVGTVIVGGLWACGEVVQVYSADKVIVNWTDSRTDCVRLTPLVKLQSLYGVRVLLDSSPAGVAAYSRAVGLSRQYSFTHPANFTIGRKLADLSQWKKLGLCPEIDGSTLMWKVVHHAHASVYKGMMGAEYFVGQEYDRADSMATAGPVGAIRTYGNTKPYVAAILAHRVEAEVNSMRSDGGFYVPSGRVIAIYRVDNRIYSHDGEIDIDVTLVEGIDAMALING